MSTERATWSYTYEKGLVDVMKGLANLPMLKGQNGWTSEGWRNIIKQFNDTFPNAHFTKQQIQEKEKELKASYKVIRDARKSGVGWNNSLGMIIAEPNIWKKLIDDSSKIAKFQKKTFPLYDSLESLHEGNIATGDLNFTSTEFIPPTTGMQVPFPPLPQRTEIHMAIPRVECTPQRSTSEQSIHNTVSIANLFSSGFDGIESTEAQSAPSSLNSEDQDVTGGKKRKQSQMAVKLGDYIEYRKSQAEETLRKLDEKKRLEGEYSVGKCIDVVDTMQDLTDEEKADTNDLLQSEMNRQIFMKTKNPNVRLIWLKKKISKMGSNV